MGGCTCESDDVIHESADFSGEMGGRSRSENREGRRENERVARWTLRGKIYASSAAPAPVPRMNFSVRAYSRAADFLQRKRQRRLSEAASPRSLDSSVSSHLSPRLGAPFRSLRPMRS